MHVVKHEKLLYMYILYIRYNDEKYNIYKHSRECIKKKLGISFKTEIIIQLTSNRNLKRRIENIPLIIGIIN